MIKSILTLVILNIFLVSCSQSLNEIDKNNETLQGVIYGEDSRTEASPEHAHITPSLAIFIPNKNLEYFNSGYYLTRTKSFKDSANLCPGERFLHQPLLGSCSGALVGPDLVLTAGHCIPEISYCQDYKISFGWDIDKSQTGIISKKDIYTCKKILQHVNDPMIRGDYALIQLDRKVNAKPLKVAKSAITNELLSGSYPHGLPLKYDYAKAYQNIDTRHFKVQVDTSHASSGSPLLNKNREVVGILSMGNQDYYFDTNPNNGKECLRLQKCKGYECTGQIYYNLKDLIL